MFCGFSKNFTTAIDSVHSFTHDLSVPIVVSQKKCSTDFLVDKQRQTDSKSILSVKKRFNQFQSVT